MGQKKRPQQNKPPRQAPKRQELRQLSSKWRRLRWQSTKRQELDRQESRRLSPWVIPAVMVVTALVAIALVLAGTHRSDSFLDSADGSNGDLAARFEKSDEKRGDGTQFAGEIEDLVSRTPAFSGSEFRSSVYGDTCPVRLPQDCVQTRYEPGIATESWHGYSIQECREAAKGLLQALEEDGYVLVQAGFLDLSREAWGCVVQAWDQSAFIITLIPENRQVSGNPSYSGNTLRITVVHIRVPEVEIKEIEELRDKTREESMLKEGT